MNYPAFTQNKNITPFHGDVFFNYPVQTHRGPLTVEYLERLNQVIHASLVDYSRVFAFRCDLHLPAGLGGFVFDDNALLNRVIASLKAKVKHNRDQAKRLNPFAHDTVVRYVWCREIGDTGRPHYHLAILLNYDAFCTLGLFELGRDNLYNRMIQAWASALGLDPFDAERLVHFPDKPFYVLRLDDQQSISDFFYRVSYLCKAQSKQYGKGVHCFGASRV